MTQSKNITNSLRFLPSILMAFSDKMKIQLHTKEATAGRWSRGRKPLFKEIPNRLNRFHSPKMQQLFDGTVCIFNTFQILCTYHVPFAVVVALKALHLID